MTEKHRRAWFAWLTTHCAGCGAVIERYKLLGQRCSGGTCSLLVASIDPNNLLEHLETAWLHEHGPSGRVAGPAWSILRRVAGEYRVCGDDGTGYGGLDEELDKLVKALVEVGG